MNYSYIKIKELVRKMFYQNKDYNGCIKILRRLHFMSKNEINLEVKQQMNWFRYLFLSKCNYMIGKYYTANLFARQCFKYSNENTEDEYPKALWMQALCLRELNNNIAATNMYNKAIMFCRARDNYSLLAELLNSKGYFKKNKQYLLEAISIYTALKADKKNIDNVWDTMCRISSQNNDNTTLHYALHNISNIQMRQDLIKELFPNNFNLIKCV